jgi:hypothetical protein
MRVVPKLVEALAAAHQTLRAQGAHLRSLWSLLLLLDHGEYLEPEMRQMVMDDMAFMVEVRLSYYRHLWRLKVLLLGLETGEQRRWIHTFSQHGGISIG